MYGTRVVKTVNKHRLKIKLVFGLLIKLVLLLIWGISIWAFYTLLYDRYVLEAYPLRDIYYRVKAWYFSLKDQSLVGTFIFYSIDFVIKLGILMYGTIIVLAIVIFVFLT